jgi:hypothetical protein
MAKTEGPPAAAEDKSKFIRPIIEKMSTSTVVDVDYNNQEVKILKSYIKTVTDEKLKNGKLFACVKDVLCHPYAYNNIFLYGRSVDEKPYIFHTLRVKPFIYAKKLKIIDPNYHPKASIRMLQNTLTTGNQSTSEVIARSFSNTKYKVFDTDIDAWACSSFVRERCFDTKYIHWRQLDGYDDAPIPVIHPKHLMMYLNFTVPESELMKYPKCFEEKHAKDSTNVASKLMADDVDYMNTVFGVQREMILPDPMSILSSSSGDIVNQSVEMFDDEIQEILMNEINTAKEAAARKVKSAGTENLNQEGLGVNVSIRSQLRLLEGDQPGDDPFPDSQSEGLDVPGEDKHLESGDQNGLGDFFSDEEEQEEAQGEPLQQMSTSDQEFRYDDIPTPETKVYRRLKRASEAIQDEDDQ